MKIPDIFIKNVAIRIDGNYQLKNVPFKHDDEAAKGRDANAKGGDFIGREKLKAKMMEYLKNGGERGVFLVTGYRGMGKTSFVHHVLQDFIQREGKPPKKVVKVMDITLAQNNLTEEFILRNIVNTLFDIERRAALDIQRPWERLKRWVLLCIYTLLPLLIIPGITFIFPDSTAKYIESTHYRYETAILFLQAAGFVEMIALIVAVIALIWLLKRKKRVPESYSKIEMLYRRCYGAFSLETQEEQEFAIEKLPARWNNKSSEKQTFNYPIATIREVEYELETYLAEQKEKCRYIFIFDELDKIELPALTTSYFEDLSSFENNRTDTNYLQQLRKRKQTIINTIAGLKSFLTKVDATFFFIAGREMFDASLADIADRESSISSIFTFVFYVESFLKESVGQKTSNSLSTAIENYLCLLLCGKREEGGLFDQLVKLLKDTDVQERNKIIVSLQNYIIYLTYRSNGSPKKLIKAIHEFIRIHPLEKLEDEEREERTIVATLGNEGDRYVYFDFNDQYRIGFINYLYRPFLIKYGKSFKHYSDSIIAATPYLFDHLFKFHPFAFSFKNLEMIPEVLSTSKTLSLKEHIQKIVDYLYNSHIRETEIGLFEYKFYSRILNEITFISKTFEEESAAFNFTLDESYLVKLHVRTKIKELRSIYSRFRSDEKSKQQIFSIFYLNTILGDLHFFDQEYDDAITAYSDAINPTGGFGSEFSYLDFVAVLSCKLKLGLAFEKIGSYEEALSYYTDATDDSKRFVLGRLSLKLDFSCNKTSDVMPDKAALREILQILNQSFLAKISIEEKMDLNGISTSSLMVTITDFLQLSQLIEQHSCKYHLIHANFLLVLGNILYFKNAGNQLNIDVIQQFPEYDETKTFKEYFYNLQRDRSNSHSPFAALSLYISGLEQVISSMQGSASNNYSMFSEPNPWSLSFPEKMLDSCIHLIRSKNIGIERVHFRYIAILLSNIGNCMLSMSGKDKIESDLLENHRIDFNVFWDSGAFAAARQKLSTDPSLSFSTDSGFLECIKTSQIETEVSKIYPISTIIRYYYLSALFFLKAGRSTTSCYQLKKILYVLRLVIPNYTEPAKEGRDFLHFVWHWIISPIFQISSRIAEFSDSHMSNKLEVSLGKENRRYIRENISNHPETREATMLYYYIYLKITKDTASIAYLISPYNSIASQFTRLLELDFYQKLTQTKLHNLKKTLSEEHPEKREDLIQENINYLYSLVTIIKTLNIYGISYTISYNYIAYAHLRIAEWLFDEKKENMITKPEKDLILEEVKKASDDKSSAVLHDTLWHFKMARSYYEKGIQLHTGGYEYRGAMNELVYLEDDFNDNAFNFGAAMERYLFTNGAMDRWIKKCSTAIHNLQVQENREDLWIITP